jgi:hypothetical protein
MEKSLEIIEMLNDLIRIHQWRMTKYDGGIRVFSETDNDLLIMFNGMVLESSEMIKELTREVEVLRGEISLGIESGGRIFKVWELKSCIGKDQEIKENKWSILHSCVSSEASILEIYELALVSPLFPRFIRQILTRHTQFLNASRDEIISFTS